MDPVPYAHAHAHRTSHINQITIYSYSLEHHWYIICYSVWYKYKQIHFDIYCPKIKALFTFTSVRHASTANILKWCLKVCARWCLCLLIVFFSPFDCGLQNSINKAINLMYLCRRLIWSLSCEYLHIFIFHLFIFRYHHFLYGPVKRENQVVITMKLDK